MAKVMSERINYYEQAELCDQGRDRRADIYFIVVFAGEEIKYIVSRTARLDAECAFADAVVRAEQEFCHRGERRRVELRFAGVLLDVAHVAENK